jgi:hypothetical protein
MTADSSLRGAWRLALVCVLAALPLRLWFFYGYGLGDDPNFATTPLNAIETGRLDFRDHHTNRLLMLLPQVLAFRLLPVNDFSFVLPILIFALGTNLLTVLLVGDLLGVAAAAVAALLALVTPFETLIATAFVPDAILGFYSVACVWGACRGYVRRSRAVMALAGGLLAATLFVKASAILLLPVAVLATLLGRRFASGWFAFWLAAAVVIAVVSALFAWLAGSPFHWYTHRAIPPWGHDVTEQLWFTLGVYPRYVFGPDPDYGGWMFGIAGYLALAGGGVAVVEAVRRRSVPAVVVALLWAYILLFNFAPHKLEIARYYSHPRIFRYLAQVAPFVYVAAAFLVARLYGLGRAGRAVGLVVTGAAVAVGLVQTPATTKPSWDSNTDGRLASAFFRSRGPLSGASFFCDFWYCERLRDMHYPVSKDWRVTSANADSRDRKRAFLAGIEEGYVITGGAGLPWYSSRSWLLTLSQLGFDPPQSWTLLFQHDGPRERWRPEPLRIWYVGDPGDDAPVFVPDEGLRRCLRVHALPAWAAATGAPLTRRLARRALHVECPGANIADVRGLEHFTGVRVLNLANNRIREIDLGPFREARLIIVGVNQLERVSGLEHLEKLETLWLGANRLRTLDVGGLKNLVDLRLDANRLESLTGTGGLGRLKLLFLADNPALDCGRVDVPASLLTASRCGE